MRILIDGNMASGKSLYARALANRLSLPLLSMDQFRTKAWAENIKGGQSREHTARHYMMQAIKENEGFVLERTGTGVFDESVLHELNAQSIPFMRALIDSKPTACVKRMENRGNQRAYPLPEWMKDPEEFIYRTQPKLTLLFLAKTYKAVINNNREKTMKEVRQEVGMLVGVARRFFEKEVVVD